MAIKIEFDNTHNILKPTLVLATRKGRKIGSIPACNIVFKDCLNSYADFSFRIYKEDCKSNIGFWEQIVDFKLLWVREWNKWFEIYVEVDESNDIVKNVSAKSLGEAELSQINLYNIEINTETDISRDDYEPTVLYKSSNPNASLLTRITEKIPHYIIKHVDASIAGIQRTFTFDNTTIYDAFQAIAKEINCLFLIDCYSDNDGNIIREISVYDLESNCLDCGERGEFSGICTKCGSKNIYAGYGKDTTIFVSTNNLADNITYKTDNGSVKNCFKLEAGDDLMTATIVNCNPNGSSYIWYISDDVKKDMSKELVEKIEQYDKDYAYYQNAYQMDISGNLLNSYNNLIDKYKSYTAKYSKITSPIIGYSALMEAYYNTIDFYLYLNHSMMPSIETSKTNASTEASKLRASSLSPIAVRNLAVCSKTTADSSVLSIARTLVNNRYQVKIIDSSFSGSTWSGIFTVKNYSDDNDTATTGRITVTLTENYVDYVEQKIERSLRQSTANDEITDIVELFALGNNAFSSELKKYSLSRLKSFYDSCQTCIDVLMEQGVGNKQTWSESSPNLYNDLYLSYYNKLNYLADEIKVRENEISLIAGTYDSNGCLITNGLQTMLDKERDLIHDYLDFEKYLGRDLWLEFAAYRREDTYKNANYISDGLNNAELFNNARKFIKTAENEIYKSAILQHSITATLKNLLVMKEFAPIVDYFEVGNWIRIGIDDNIYRLRLLDYEIDFENLDNISITFSDVTIANGGQSDISSILNQASSMASSYDSTKRQAETSKNRLDNWVQKGLDATNVKIVSNADNQNQSWDSHGMLFRAYDSITDSYDDCQLKIINSTLAITNDNWKSIKTAIGGFYYFNPTTGNLEYAYGVNAETIIGKILLGEQLGIYSENNSLTFDKNGLTVTNGKNTFSVNPNSNNLFVLSNDQDDILWVDTKGNLQIKGTLQGCNGTFSGELQAATGSFSGSLKAATGSFMGELNVGNGNFVVDTNGNLTAKSGTFKGTIYGATYKDINGNNMMNGNGEFKSGYLNLNGINVGNGNFVVDNNGEVTVRGNIKMGSGSSINWSNISETNYTDSKAYKLADDAYSIADDAYTIAENASRDASDAYDTVSGWTYRDSTYIDGRKIMTGTVMASTLQGGEIDLLGEDESDCGVISLSSASSAPYAVDFTSNAAMRISSNKGSLYLASKWNFININNDDPISIGNVEPLKGSHGIVPASDNMYILGNAVRRWYDIYAVTSTISSSDARAKKDIEYDMNKYLDFFFDLKPTQYKFKDNKSNRYHIGFISQEVEEAMTKNGLDSTDFAGFIKSPIYDENDETVVTDYIYGLRYSEFIALNTHMIQKLYQRINELENIIAELKG